ncbi:hypothetical protein Osc2_11560 [Ruminococcus sp. 25CYCFAH16]
MPDIAAQHAAAVIKLKKFFMSFIASLSLIFKFILPLVDCNVNINYNSLKNKINIPDNRCISPLNVIE